MHRWATVKGSRRKIGGGQAVKANIRRSNILTPVAAVDTVPIGVTPPCRSLLSRPFQGLELRLHGVPVRCSVLNNMHHEGWARGGAFMAFKLAKVQC